MFADCLQDGAAVTSGSLSAMDGAISPHYDTDRSAPLTI